MHTCQYHWFHGGKFVYEGATILRMGIVIEGRAGLLAGFQYITFGDRGMVGSHLGEEVAAKQRACPVLK